MGGDGDRRRRRARRARRAHRAGAERHLAVRRGARFARRFRRFRRRAGDRALFLRPARDEEPRLARGAGVRDRLRAAAGAVQRDDRRSRHAGLAQVISSSACRRRRARSSGCCRSFCISRCSTRPTFTRLAPLEVAYVLAIAFLMASRVPHFSGKSIGRVPREYVAVVLFGVAAACCSSPISRWKCWSALSLAYLASIPFSVRRFRQLRRADEKDNPS